MESGQSVTQNVGILSCSFDEQRSTEAAGFFIQKYKESTLRDISIQECMRLLYMADKYSYRDNAQPLTGDALFAFPSGPVLLNVMRILCAPELSTSAAYWNTVIESSMHRTLRIRNTPAAHYVIQEQSYLSESDSDILVEVFGQFSGMGEAEWRSYFNDPDLCPELRNHIYAGRPVDPSDILSQYGYCAEAVQIAMDNIQKMAAVENSLRGG